MADTLAPNTPPGEYWGLKVIAKRMNVSKNTILAWQVRHLFPMWVRPKGPRKYFYTTESLIARWEGGMCLAEAYRRRQRQGRPSK
jgi:hypothetical protein